jgi:hypothetical protein
MTWDELQRPIYEEYERAQNEDDVDIDGYDVKVNDSANGAPVIGFEVDHDAQVIVLKTGRVE